MLTALVALAVFVPTAAASGGNLLKIVISPTAHDYGTIDSGTSATQTFVVTNKGLLPTAKLKVTLAGSAAFTKTADSCAGKFLWPKKTCAVTVRYGPTSAGSTDTGTLKVAGIKVSATATLTGKSTAVDDPPVAVNDSATVDEDAAATSIPVLANDTDVDGPPLTIASTSDPANGTVAVTGGGTGLTYEPDQDYCNTEVGGTPDTFTYTLTGGSTATVSVTVVCVPESADISITVAGAGTFTTCPPGWLLNVTNNGPSDAVVEILEDFSAADGPGVTGPGTWQFVVGIGSTQRWRNTIPAGSTAPFTVTACNPSGVNSIEVYSSSVPDPDSTPNNGTSNGEDDYVVVVGSGPT